MNADRCEQRLEINEIDCSIIELLKRRASISRDIQIDRVRSGGARTDLAREREVISAYADQLGPRGAEIANMVLTYCRGEVDDAARNERQSQAFHAVGVAG